MEEETLPCVRKHVTRALSSYQDPEDDLTNYGKNAIIMK